MYICIFVYLLKHILNISIYTEYDPESNTNTPKHEFTIQNTPKSPTYSNLFKNSYLQRLDIHFN